MRSYGNLLHKNLLYNLLIGVWAQNNTLFSESHSKEKMKKTFIRISFIFFPNLNWFFGPYHQFISR